ESAQCFAHEITTPILRCFSDEDDYSAPGPERTIRGYKACEAFYNVAKVIRRGVLQDMESVFDGLCKLYTDVEQTIKEGAQSLDRLVRDIVVEQRRFDYSTLIPLIAARIHVLNPSVRQLVLGWIVLLDSLPQVDMIAFLPHYLEGLFGILASDNRDFRMQAAGRARATIAWHRGLRGT
ncbi:Protein VAC14 homolog, partial [Durusdinium trenchii]